MSTSITLEPEDGAFIVRANGDQEIFLPHHKDDDIVPPHIERLARAIMAIDDDRVVSLIEQIINDRSVN